jgi:hypothetical protein
MRKEAAMENLKSALFTAMVAVLLHGCVVYDRDRDQWASCGREHRLQVVDLDMSPDPVAAGQRIDRFRVSLRSDGSGECATRIQIRETQGDDRIAAERVYRLRPGTNQISIEPEERYRFSRQEHCFTVQANIENTARPIDAARRFCAREVGSRRWSLNP